MAARRYQSVIASGLSIRSSRPEKFDRPMPGTGPAGDGHGPLVRGQAGVPVCDTVADTGQATTANRSSTASMPGERNLRLGASRGAASAHAILSAWMTCHNVRWPPVGAA